MKRSSHTDRGVPRMRPLSNRRPTVVSVLDIGSSKVACIIARLTPRSRDKILPGRTHDITVLGHGIQRARGMKAGTVIDLDNALKIVLDCLQSCKVIKNDRLCAEIFARKLIDKKEPRIYLELEELL